jgi:hypothetical protein
MRMRPLWLSLVVTTGCGADSSGDADKTTTGGVARDKPLQEVDAADAERLCEAFEARTAGRHDYLERWCNAVGVAAANRQGGSCAEHRDTCLSVAPFDCDEGIFLKAAEAGADCPAMTVGAFLDCSVAVARRGLSGYPGVTCTTPVADVARYEREIGELMDAGLPEECAESLRLCPDTQSSKDP